MSVMQKPFVKRFIVDLIIDPPFKKAYVEVHEEEGRTYTIEYVGDGKEFHGTMQNNSLVTNVESWREALQNILKYSSKVIFTRFHDYARDISYRSRIKVEEVE